MVPVTCPTEDELVASANGAGYASEGAMLALIERHTPLMKRIISKVRVAPEDQEDALQAATSGFIAAVRRFRPGTGARLATFGYHHIHGQVIADIFGKDWQARQGSVAIDAPNVGAGQLDGVLVAGEDPVVVVIGRDLSRRIRARVSAFDGQILAERLAAGESHAAVARRLGVHSKRVDRAIHRLRVVAEEVMIAKAA